MRRRDNLVAAFHMLVEACFWFHPLVWWLGARLVEERERACDEYVLQLGNPRRVYAESILKTCEFCVEAPLACMSGVAGSDLRSRIARIMAGPAAHRLSLSRKLLLALAAVLAVALPSGFGLLYAPQTQAANTAGMSAGISTGYIAEDTAAKLPEYEVVSIKVNKSGEQMTRLMYNANGFNATTMPLNGLIRDAYGLQENRLLGAPGWLGSENYDIEAKVDNADVPVLQNLSLAQRAAMLRPVLRDRLQLTVHWETRQLTVYSLVADKSGVKLHEAKAGDTYPNGLKGPDDKPGGAGDHDVSPGEPHRPGIYAIRPGAFPFGPTRQHCAG